MSAVIPKFHGAAASHVTTVLMSIPSFSEETRTTADRDFQILRPQALRDERLLQSCCGFRSRLDRKSVGPYTGSQIRADALREGEIAACPLVDHPLECGHRKRYAACLDDLQINRGKGAESH